MLGFNITGLLCIKSILADPTGTEGDRSPIYDKPQQHEVESTSPISSPWGGGGGGFTKGMNSKSRISYLGFW